MNVDDELEVYEHLLDTLRQTNRTLVALGQSPGSTTPSSRRSSMARPNDCAT
jgi:hypothetical protein